MSEQVSTFISDFFSENKIDKIARASKFIQRESKLKAHMFLESIMFNAFDNTQTSLNDYTDSLFLRHNVKVSKQAIYERFNKHSVHFVKTVLKQLIKSNLNSHINSIDFTTFKRVLIKDSTAFELPSYMKRKYAGNGGNSSESAVRIQYEYDLKSCDVIDLSLNSSKINDYTNAKRTMSKVRKGDLIVRDLGYSALERLKEIKQKKAFFLNRLKSDMGIYQKLNGKYVRISNSKIRKELLTSGKEYIEKDIYIGHRKYMPVRLIIFKVPENKVQNRLIKQLKKSERRKAKVCNTVINRIDLNMFITNVNNTVLDAKSIFEIYKLRWQIELIFKIWKSLIGIHLYKPVKQERIETIIYAKLILIILNWKIITEFTNHVFNKIRSVISYHKAYKTLLSFKTDLMQSWRSDKMLKALLILLYKKFLYSHIKEKRKGSAFSPEILLRHTV